jgi:hypothetical protein
MTAHHKERPVSRHCHPPPGAPNQIYVSGDLDAYDWHCGFNACIFQTKKMVLKLERLSIKNKST